MKSRERHLRAAGGRSRPGVILALTCAVQFSIAAALVAGLMLRRAERAAASARPQEPAPEPALRAV